MVKRYFYLLIYYGFARWLPCSYKSVFSKKIRYCICKHLFKSIGNNVNIERGAWFSTGEDIEIGNNSGIGINARIYKNTIIGNNVMMGPNCYFLESSHNFNRVDIPMVQQGSHPFSDQVKIEDDVWIGRDVMVLGSKTIRKGTIVGARCLLTKSFPEYSIVGGNPSILIRSRLQ